MWKKTRKVTCKKAMDDDGNLTDEAIEYMFRQKYGESSHCDLKCLSLDNLRYLHYSGEISSEEYLAARDYIRAHHST